MQNTKIIITGAQNIDKLDIATRIVEIDDDLSIAYTFTSDENYKYNTENFKYYLDANEIGLSYKNNALLFISNPQIYNESISEGITMDQFYNSDIFCISIKDFNNISESIFQKNNILVIWVDTSNTSTNDNLSQDILETQYLIERLKYNNYLYFLNTPSTEIVNVIFDYLSADDEKKAEILLENS